jgi:hypothetical protein
VQNCLRQSAFLLRIAWRHLLHRSGANSEGNTPIILHAIHYTIMVWKPTYNFQPIPSIPSIRTITNTVTAAPRATMTAAPPATTTAAHRTRAHRRVHRAYHRWAPPSATPALRGKRRGGRGMPGQTRACVLRATTTTAGSAWFVRLASTPRPSQALHVTRARQVGVFCFVLIQEHAEKIYPARCAASFSTIAKKQRPLQLQCPSELAPADDIAFYTGTYSKGVCTDDETDQPKGVCSKMTVPATENGEYTGDDAKSCQDLLGRMPGIPNQMVQNALASCCLCGRPATGATTCSFCQAGKYNDQTQGSSSCTSCVDQSWHSCTAASDCEYEGCVHPDTPLKATADNTRCFTSSDPQVQNGNTDKDGNAITAGKCYALRMDGVEAWLCPAKDKVREPCLLVDGRLILLPAPLGHAISRARHAERARGGRPQVCARNILCAGGQIESAVGSTAVSNCEGAAYTFASVDNLCTIAYHNHGHHQTHLVS